MKPQQVEYELTIDDDLAFYEHALPLAAVTKHQIRYVMFLRSMVILFGGILMWILYASGPMPIPIYAIPVLMIVLSLMTGLRTSKRIHKEQMRNIRRLLDEPEQRRRLGPRKIIIALEGVTSADSLGATVQSWAAFTEITTISGHLFLQQDSLSAYIVPQRAFADEFEFEKFVEAAQYFKAKSDGKIPDDTEFTDEERYGKDGDQ